MFKVDQGTTEHNINHCYIKLQPPLQSCAQIMRKTINFTGK